MTLPPVTRTGTHEVGRTGRQSQSRRPSNPGYCPKTKGVCGWAIGAVGMSVVGGRAGGVATSTKGEFTMREREVIIRLIQDLPIDPRHGMMAGRELRAIRATPIEHPKRYLPRWIVVGDAGEKVGVFSREAEVVNTDDTRE